MPALPSFHALTFASSRRKRERARCWETLSIYFSLHNHLAAAARHARDPEESARLCPRPTELNPFPPSSLSPLFLVRQAELDLLAEETKKILEQREEEWERLSNSAAESLISKVSVMKLRSINVQSIFFITSTPRISRRVRGETRARARALSLNLSLSLSLALSLSRALSISSPGESEARRCLMWLSLSPSLPLSL